VTGLITERGVCPASPAGLLELFPEHESRVLKNSPTAEK